VQDRETQIIMQSPRGALPGVEDGVTVVRYPVKDGGLAGAAGPFAAGGQHLHAGLLRDGQDGPVNRNGQGQVAAPQVNIERLGQDGLGEGLGHESLDVQGPGRPAGAALLNRVEQRLGSAAVAQRAGLRGAEQVGQGQQARSNRG